MLLGILNMPHQIVGEVGIKIKTSITGVRNQTVVENMSQSRWKGHFCKQNKLANFVSKFKAKHAIEE